MTCRCILTNKETKEQKEVSIECKSLAEANDIAFKLAVGNNSYYELKDIH